MLSSNLEITLRNAYQLATDNKHEFVTLEHLLNSLTNDKDAISVLKACGVEIEQLKNNLEEFIKNDLSNLTDNFSGDVTSTGIDVYDDMEIAEFSKKMVGNKTLYTIGVNWEDSLTIFNHLARVLDMIPATVNKYEDPPNELVTDNLLVTQTLS